MMKHQINKYENGVAPYTAHPPPPPPPNKNKNNPHKTQVSK